jgi:hypothetical protein
MGVNLDDVKAVLQDTTVASMAGSAVSLKFVPGASWSARFSSLLTGFVVAFYGTAPALTWMGVSSQSGAALGGFIAGFLGVNIISKLWDYARETNFPELVTSLINVFRKNP